MVETGGGTEQPQTKKRRVGTGSNTAENLDSDDEYVPSDDEYVPLAMSRMSKNAPSHAQRVSARLVAAKKLREERSEGKTGDAVTTTSLNANGDTLQGTSILCGSIDEPSRQHLGTAKVSGAKVKFEADKPEDVGAVCNRKRRDLVSDLRAMINRPECSDVVFKCNDGVQVHACRLLLASRCAVFKGLLSNGILENKTEILLPKFSSSVVLSIVENLYTGVIESHYPRTWKMGFEMISAGQFFIIPEVEEYAQKFLWTQLGIHTRKSSLMEMLSIAVEFAETWKAKDQMLRDLVRYIGPDWSDEDCCRKLSRKAVECILLSNSERDSGTEESGLFVEEYFTFRKIVLWHVYQTMPTVTVEAKAALRNMLPGEELSLLWRRTLKVPVDIDSFLLSTSASVDSFDSSATLNCLLGTNVCKDSLMQLLAHVKLTLMPAPLLLKVIHPLKVIPSQQLLKALVNVAVHRRSLARFDWKHGPFWKVGEDGEIVCSSEDAKGRGIGIAVISSPRSSDVLEWKFRILDNDVDLIELGFICQPTGNCGISELDKARLNLWDLSSSRVLLFDRRSRKTFVSRKLPIISIERFWDPDTWERSDVQVGLNSEVKFQLNVLERTCQVSVGKSFKAAWEGLPDGDYHPAVGFSHSKRARVELRVAGGYDSF